MYLSEMESFRNDTFARAEETVWISHHGVKTPAAVLSSNKACPAAEVLSAPYTTPDS